MQMRIRLKYGVDRIVALIAAVILSPLLGLIAVALLVSSGLPIFFRQERPGLGGKNFRMWKFRTMINDADSFLSASGAPTRPRVTPLGRALRKSSLDELPNLFNVIAGDMSLVGPRPVLPGHAKRYSKLQARRFEMKPGITGLAQISGRNSLPWSMRLALDVFYVDNYTFSQDARILLRTAVAVFSRSHVASDSERGSADDLCSETVEQGRVADS